MAAKRSAHREVVKRRIQELDTILAEEEPDLTRLKQLRLLFIEKIEVLGKLDEEVLDSLGDEAAMGLDIEEADAFRQDVYCAIERLEAKLDSSSSISSAEGGTGHAWSGSASHDTPIRPKLPDLTLNKFDGDITNWHSFWDSYETAVHNNTSLSDINKFTYLKSLVVKSAKDAIEGLALTASNYKEAIVILKKRFGNPQLIISKHMEELMNTDAVSSVLDITALRRMYDKVEVHVRGLRSLGVASASYGALLMPVLQKKLPPELRIVINREITESSDLDKLMTTLADEIEVRERSVVASGTSQPSFKRRSTTTTFMTGNQPVSCAYCGKRHLSEQCLVISQPEARRLFLRSSGRCYVCLKKGHLSNRCSSTVKCTRCTGPPHHVSLCGRRRTTGEGRKDSGMKPAESASSDMPLDPEAPPFEKTQAYTTLYTEGNGDVLLQTAQVTIFNPINPNKQLVAHLILDSGSHKSYVTERIQKALKLKSMGKRKMSIVTFGSEEPEQRDCHEVNLGLCLKNGTTCELLMLTVPFICDNFAPAPLSICLEDYPHLVSLDSADIAQRYFSGPPEVLIGSDQYWQLVTGKVMRGSDGPVAMHTKLGWMLTGPISCHNAALMFNNSIVAVSLKASLAEGKSLDRLLKAFWDLESLGIFDREQTLYDQFKHNISFVDGRYEVSLPWRSSLLTVSLNYNLCQRRLKALLRRLRQDPELLREYNAIIEGQLKSGIIELVDNADSISNERTHYLPHHAVVRRDKATTKVRVVYDASAKAEGSSLNECLHVGPKFSQNMLELLIRFRIFQIALIADIEKAFLMISVAPKDRDVLRFLWVKEIANSEAPEVLVYRFKRVVFGVASSPFLLNATVRHHIEDNQELFPQTACKMLRSMYVDDMISGCDDEAEAYQLYVESKEMLKKGSFNLRKFVTNSRFLQEKINKAEGVPLYDENLELKVLGIHWEVLKDQLVFNPADAVNLEMIASPTKRSVVSAVSQFYDPLGILSPVIIKFKIFLQELTRAEMEWDQPLTGSLLERWKMLVLSLRKGPSISVPRVYLHDTRKPDFYQLCGFSDASTVAYAAVVYLVITIGRERYVRLVASKTRVAPRVTQTVPRLELIGALLLARLMETVKLSLQEVIVLQQPMCYIDSKVALYWIYGLDKEWKPFIQNRSEEIRALIPPSGWRHCPGRNNPADAPSRGITLAELASDLTWFNGPTWLIEQSETDSDQLMEMPKECAKELRAHERRQVFSLLVTESIKMRNVIDIDRYGRLDTLLQVTSHVLRFVLLLRKQTGKQPAMALKTRSEVLWLKECQTEMLCDPRFASWKQQLGLFLDHEGLWRCGGRLSNANIPYSTKHPVLLNRKHPFTVLIIRYAHERVMHNGVKETLTEIRSKYWIIKGRSLIRQILFRCTVCRRLEALPYKAPPPPPLPLFRVMESPPFTFTGVDFAGPLYVKSGLPCRGDEKVWICLFTCAVTRAIHLEIVIDLCVSTFIRCLKRFVSRRGLPQRIVSDNGKTFRGAAKVVRRIMRDPEVQKHLSGVGVSWQFNVERAPWWGGMFERMVGSAKRCLRKIIGKSRLSYDELNTIVIEIESIINSRPISYLATDDIEEPLTPSHLMIGRRLLDLPDNLCFQEGDEDYALNTTTEVLTRRMKYLNTVLNKYWKRWTREYLTGLRESHFHYAKKRNRTEEISIGDVVVIHNDQKPRGYWNLGRVEQTIPGKDGLIRSAMVRVYTGGKRSKLFRRPVQLLYPVEVSSRMEPLSLCNEELEPGNAQPAEDHTPEDTSSCRPKRNAALRARDRVLAQALSD